MKTILKFKDVPMPNIEPYEMFGYTFEPLDELPTGEKEYDFFFDMYGNETFPFINLENWDTVDPPYIKFQFDNLEDWIDDDWEHSRAKVNTLYRKGYRIYLRTLLYNWEIMADDLVPDCVAFDKEQSYVAMLTSLERFRHRFSSEAEVCEWFRKHLWVDPMDRRRFLEVCYCGNKNLDQLVSEMKSLRMTHKK